MDNTVALLLSLISFRIYMDTGITLSNKFDDLFEKDGFGIDIYANNVIQAVSMRDTTIPDAVEKIWLLGYPDLASKAKQFLQEHELLK